MDSASSDTFRAVAYDVLIERGRQDAQWGGPAHDDTHSVDDWCSHIDHQLSFIHYPLKDATPEEERERFIKIAALAVAAVESLDRKKHG